VAVIAPGGGTGINGKVYSDLGRNPEFRVEIVGNSRAPYDCYPEAWPHGGPAPNLASFAQEVLDKGLLERTDCLVVGSRGGQVVLPHFWEQRGVHVPPAVVINGGIAMSLPKRVPWPASAITFLLVGGQDNFRGKFTPEQYVAETKSHVPEGNGTTAILYVQEMQHMPQAKLLAAVLPHMLRVVLHWKAGAEAPVEHFRLILRVLRGAGWSGRLLYTRLPSLWEDLEFSSGACGPRAPQALPRAEAGAPVELTRPEEMRALWRAAAAAARPEAKGARLAAVAKAARARSPRALRA